MKNVKAWVRDAYGGACKCCGRREGEVRLQLDHVMGYDGSTPRSGDALWRWACRNGCPSMLQLLCADCNSSKTRGGWCRMHERVISRDESVSVMIRQPMDLFGEMYSETNRAISAIDAAIEATSRNPQLSALTVDLMVLRDRAADARDEIPCHEYIDGRGSISDPGGVLTELLGQGEVRLVIEPRS